MAKRKEFSILKWIVFPLNSVTLAAIVAYFNITVFGLRDGLPYSIIVAMIGVFSIVINKYTESDNRNLARAAFVFEICLTVALVINACYSVSVQRKMSVARMAETNQKETITEIGKLRGARTQREALKMVEKSESAQSVFANVEDVLFWIMAAELALYGLSAFTLFALAKLMADDEEQEEFPSELNVRERAASRESRFQTAKSDSERQSLILSQKSPRVSLPEPDRKAALKKLREHLKAVAFYHPNRWFKADLVRGGVTIRLFERQHGHEIAIAQTTQSDKLLAAVNRPDFRTRLVDELNHQGFPLVPAKAD